MATAAPAKIRELEVEESHKGAIVDLELMQYYRNRLDGQSVSFRAVLLRIETNCDSIKGELGSVSDKNKKSVMSMNMLRKQVGDEVFEAAKLLRKDEILDVHGTVSASRISLARPVLEVKGYSYPKKESSAFSHL